MYKKIKRSLELERKLRELRIEIENWFEKVKKKRKEFIQRENQKIRRRRRKKKEREGKGDD